MKKHFAVLAVLMMAVLAAPPALAAEGTSPPTPTVASILASAVVEVVPVLFAAVAALAVAWLSGLREKLQAQAKESKLAAIGARATMLAESVVRDMEVTLKAELEAAAADGKLTTAELQHIKAKAMEQLRASLGVHGLAALQHALGLTDGMVGTFLSGLIEAALDRVKASRAGDVAGQVMNAALSLGAIGSKTALAPVASAVP
ncbi:hypothetical protein HUA74_02615 [Myxococcus sp. CA051A]|uniref:hypothetical protein n=1 Tax=Myxococcus sp. CA051A TaxID=2741739 RepID=UPI00157AE61B|nr:hypothetical protein [Myxococcus sp. CA051A]NTX59546.1 hypothetical protein [Myxococcus sp. CA051A]